MIFLSRELLWLLVAVPGVVGAYIMVLRRRKLALRYASLRLVRDSVGVTPSLRRHVPPALFLLALIVLLLAIARPAGIVNVLSAQRTIILAMDVSLSMAATDVAPNRLAASQAAARAFIKAQPSDVRIGIVSFAATADLVQPPTADRRLLNAAIERLQLDYHTAIGTGIIAALITIFPDAGLDHNFDIFGLGGFPEGFRPASLNGVSNVNIKADVVAPGSYPSAAIILLTDGSRTMGPDPLTAAHMAADRGVRIFTVGFGSAKSARVDVDGWSMDVGFDEGSLREIASITRGEYFHANTAAALHSIYQDLSGRLIVERKETEMTSLFTAIAAILSLVAAMFSVLWFPRTA
ncbi:MAG: Ca-activated chloride channel [Betaproteobacteria bacterium]|nr:Ca-activated chloride channel [Betaproteobacteria bacterium]